MPLFKYTARDDSGASLQGTINADSELAAARQLRTEGKFIVRIERSSGAPAKASGPRRAKRGGKAFGEKLRKDDLIYATNQLAVMIDTGVSLAESLDACVHDGNSPGFNRALQAVIDQVSGGIEFSAALASQPKAFPPLFVNLVKASEASGTMGPMLRRLADYIEHQRDMRKKIRGALIYPAVMIVFAIGVTIFLMTFVLPKFAAIYAGKEKALPILTRYLMTFSDWLVHYGLYVLGGLVVGGVSLFFYARTPAGRVWLEGVFLRFPILGKLLHKTYLTRSLRTLGTMIQSGVSMLEGIQLTSTACGSHAYRRMWEDIGSRLETGQQLSEALSEQKSIPRVVNKMLNAGERSGQLGSVMDRVANFCESELNNTIKALTAMLEPAIVMFLGVVVGGLVLALLLPIFTISKVMK